MMDQIIEVNRLNKTYGDDTVVNEVSFKVEQGKIYGLLGRNGAGKTTIMHMLTAQIFPTSGELKVFGENPYENDLVLRQLCFIKESQKYPDTFRVMDVMEVAAAIYPNWDREFALQLIQEFRLPLKRRVKKLSRGMLSSVGIVIGLASRAPLTIFDEPYLGLDAVARNMFYERLIEDYSEHPRTVILSTHLIDEVSNLLEHVILIDNGKILIDEEADELRRRAFTAMGQAEKISAYTAGKHIIHQESLGGLMSATILGNLSREERQQAAAQGIEFGPVSLQELVVHLTNGKSDAKVVDTI